MSALKMEVLITAFWVSDARGACVLVPGCEQLWHRRTRIPGGVDADGKESCSWRGVASAASKEGVLWGKAFLA